MVGPIQGRVTKRVLSLGLWFLGDLSSARSPSHLEFRRLFVSNEHFRQLASHQYRLCLWRYRPERLSFVPLVEVLLEHSRHRLEQHRQLGTGRLLHEMDALPKKAK